MRCCGPVGCGWTRRRGGSGGTRRRSRSPPREFTLLETLIRRPGETLSRFELLEDGWDEAYENRSNVIDVYIGYLRDKIDRPFGVGSIVTVRGHGYRLEAP